MASHDSLTNLRFEPIPSDPEVIYNRLCRTREDVILKAQDYAEQALIRYLETNANFPDFEPALERWGRHEYLGKLATAVGAKAPKTANSPEGASSEKSEIAPHSEGSNVISIDDARAQIEQLHEKGEHHAEAT